MIAMTTSSSMLSVEADRPVRGAMGGSPESRFASSADEKLINV